MNLQHNSDKAKIARPSPESGNHGSLAVKIFCVLAAFILWVYVMSVESPEHEEIFSNVTVSLENEQALTDNGLAIYSGYGNMIDVTLAGKKSILSKLDTDDIFASVDLGGKSTSGRYDCTITVDVPAGCKLVGTSQKSISVYLDKSARTTIDLGIKVENLDLTEGCELGMIDLPYDKVDIQGAERTIDRVAGAAAVFDLTGVTATTTKSAKIILFDQYGKVIGDSYLSYSPTEIEAEVPIIKRVEVPVEVEYKYGYLNENNTAVNLSVNSITVSGNPALIDKGGFIEPIEIDEKAHFDDDGVCMMTVELDPPEGLTFSQESIDITIVRSDEIKTREITVRSGNISESGAPNDMEYTIDKSPVTVRFMGPADALSALDADDVTLWLDMSPFDKSVSGMVKVRAKVLVDSTSKGSVLELGYYDINVNFND